MDFYSNLRKFPETRLKPYVLLISLSYCYLIAKNFQGVEVVFLFNRKHARLPKREQNQEA